MAHDCVDWTTIPPTRKIPLLILTRGDDRVYTIVPKEFKTLEDVARKEFDLGGAEIILSSSCLSLCNGLPARITESAWEHISPYIGCVTVEISGPKAVPPFGAPRENQPTASTSVNTGDGRDPGIEEMVPSNADEGVENEQSEHGLVSNLATLATEVVRGQQSALSDYENNRNSVSAPEDQPEEPWEEEVSTIPVRKSRVRRRVASEAEDEESGREREASAKPRDLPIASSPPEPTQPKAKEKDSGFRLQSPEPLLQPGAPIKQEKPRSGSGSQPFPHDDSQPQGQHDIQMQAGVGVKVESSQIHKLMIRVAHRPSRQESKFTTKSTTRVAKVLSGACKSFGLDASKATMYLIVSTVDEDGEEENLFPCDRNDTIANAGAEHDTESRFLLKIAGEV